MPCEPFPRGPIKPAEAVLNSKPLRRRGEGGPSALIKVRSGPMRLTKIYHLMSGEGPTAEVSPNIIFTSVDHPRDSSSRYLLVRFR
jgi:hypothetical protein